MNLINRLINTPRVTLSIMLLVLFAGVMARSSLPVETEPNIQVPVAMIAVRHDGISPEDGVRLLIRPIEKELKTLAGLDSVNATAREGAVYLLVEFDIERDVKQAISELREAVDRASADFPKDTKPPLVKEMSASPEPEVVVVLSGNDIAGRELQRTAVRLQEVIDRLPEVLEATIQGRRDEIVEVVLEPFKLQQYGILMSELSAAMAANNLLIPAGDMDSGAGLFSIVVPALFETVADIRSLPIRSTVEGVVTLGDIASVRRTYRDARGFSQLNGRRGIAINVNKRAGANSIKTVDAVRSAVAMEQLYFSRQVQIDYIFDKSDHASTMVDELSGNILTAMSLVLIIVVATLGLKSGLLVSLAIPFSLLGSIVIIAMLGFSYNFMVMFGLLLSLGMLIDGAIVVIEFANTQIAAGLSARQAYAAAVRRMAVPVTASTGTTLAAFLPLLFWPGVVGEFMSYLPITVFAVLAWSLAYALIFAPTLGVLLAHRANTKPSELEDNESEEVSQTLFQPLLNIYLKVLQAVIRRPLLSIFSTLLILLTIFFGYTKFGAGMVFFAEVENQFGTITVRAQGNLSVEQKRALTAQVEARVKGIEEVLQLYSSSQDNQMVFKKDASRDQISSFLVELTSSSERAASSVEVFSEIRRVTADMPGILVTGKALDSGPPVGKDIQIQISSSNREAMYATTAKLRRWIGANIEGVRDLEDTMPIAGVQWKIQVDRAQASMQGVDVATVGQAIQLLTDGLIIGKFRPDDVEEEVEIRLRYPRADRQLASFDELWVNSDRGPVPIGGFTERVAAPRVDVIQRLDMRESVMIMGYTEDGYLVDDQTRQIEAWLDTQQLHPDIEVRLRGANEEQADSAAFLSTAFSMAMAVMLIMMLTQFNSFYQAFLILFSVVMSIAGVLLGLLISQGVFSTVLTGVGIVALAGIVVNNNIVLIDTYNYLRNSEPNMSAEQAVYNAAKSRFRPVMLTTITTIIGLLPLANGLSVDIVNRSWESGGMIVSWWQPLASAIVNGLALSTLMTLLLTPAMLLLPATLQRRFSRPSSIEG